MKAVPSYIARLTPETIAYIKDSFGKFSFTTIAKNCHLSVRTIEQVATYYEFGTMRQNQGLLASTELAVAFGIDQSTVKQKWINPVRVDTPLPFRKMPPTRRSKNRCIQYGFDPDEVWKWVKDHLNIVDLRKYTPFSVLPEPTWLHEAVRMQRKTLPPLLKGSKWSLQEDEQALYLYYRCGKSRKEIGAILGRTERAVDARLKRLMERKNGIRRAN